MKIFISEIFRVYLFTCTECQIDGAPAVGLGGNRKIGNITFGDEDGPCLNTKVGKYATSPLKFIL